MALVSNKAGFTGKFLSLLGLTALPDLFTPFGFYFLYGVHTEGPLCEKLVRALCDHVRNMAAASDDGGACKVVVVEVDRGSNDNDSLRECIPHWKMLSCDDDIWCIKPLRCEEEKIDLIEFTKMSMRSKLRSLLFVDPRDV